MGTVRPQVSMCTCPVELQARPNLRVHFAVSGRRSQTHDPMLSIAAAFSTSFVPPSMVRANIQMQAETSVMGSEFAKTLPGVTAPFGFFDPMGLTDELCKEEVMRFREAELAHGRVLMIAALGFLVQENFHPIFPGVGGPAARQLDTVLQSSNGQGIMATLLFGVMLTEITRARIGWIPPSEGYQELRPEYTPGDLGFDPLGMSPKSDVEMLSMKNKELNNGRLAMIAIAGICAQEVVSGSELLGSA